MCSFYDGEGFRFLNQVRMVAFNKLNNSQSNLFFAVNENILEYFKLCQDLLPELLFIITEFLFHPSTLSSRPLSV